eukprot:Clim_evm1s239 gene=Clim_evmTU1s239
MPVASGDRPTPYGPMLAFVMVFNLVVGAGVLAMPHAFAEAGLLAGSVVLVVLGAVSFGTSNAMVEAMACANAYKLLTRQNPREGDASDQDPMLINGRDDSDSIEDFFNLDRKEEMGGMAAMFFGHNGVLFFYFSAALYLFGDLAIYAAAVPKTIVQFICTDGNPRKGHDLPTDVCFLGLDGEATYRIFLAMFVGSLGLFVYTDVGKTRWLQMFTVAARYLAFGMMVGVTLWDIIGGVHVDTKTIPLVQISKLPQFFGACIYSFMCHHSLPSLLTPLTRKDLTRWILLSDYGVALMCYLLVCYTALFRFPAASIQDIYTSNFDVYPSIFIHWFLGLFPAFTLSTNFPIIGITLRNNIRTFFDRLGQKYDAARWVSETSIGQRIVCPTIAIAVPTTIAFATSDVGFLVGVTGSYAGLLIQYVFPVSLAYYGRQAVTNLLREMVLDEEDQLDTEENSALNGSSQDLLNNGERGSGVTPQDIGQLVKKQGDLYQGVNPYSTWMSTFPGFISVMAWSVGCVALVTVNHIVNGND